jgi:pimeloyl-ACP methyl ester carboxylesterase
VTIALIREMLMRQDAEGYARTCEALAEATPPEVAPIKCPVLLVAGDEDPIATATGARAIAARLAASRTRVLPRCGHWVMFERAKETAAALEEFFLQRR